MLIVTPNPAVDHTVRLAELRPGEVMRARSGVSVAGGKGGNVARAARLLGADPTVLAFVPDTGSEHLRALYTAEGFRLAGIPVPGRVRTCTAIIADSGEVTLINEPGAVVTSADWGRLMSAADEHLRNQAAARDGAAGPGIVLCSGSLPPGAPDDGYAEIVRAGRAAGCEVLVDASGAPLARAIEAGADLVCPNVSEAESILCTERGDHAFEAGRPHAGTRELVDDGGADVPDRARFCAAALLGRGARWAVVTAGSAGAALAGPGVSMWFPAPRVAVRNPIGAGDSFLAGVATARAAGRYWPSAVRRGLAAGSASVEQDAAGVVDPARVDQLEAQLAAAVR